MTKEITRAIILQEIQDKFKLRELDPAVFSFSEMVVPIYNIEPHLLKPELKVQSYTITGLGGKVFMMVPPNQKWRLHGYNVIFMSGVFTVAGVMILRPTGEDWLYLDLEAAQNVSYAVDLPKDVILFPGEYISINIDGFTSNGTLELRVAITVDEIR